MTPLQADLLEAALSYAARGWPVFPCKSDKRPYTAHGFKDATTNATTIREWWARWPGAALGLDCGGAGLVVIDCDVKNGIDGIANFEALGIDHDGALHATTPSGGLHIVFRVNETPLGNSAGKLAPGIDTRGAGGYIILPPSQIDSGKYIALDDWQREPPPLTGALEALLIKRPAAITLPTSPLTPGAGYGDAALAAEVETVARAAEGARNDTLNRAAYSLGQLVAGGELDRAMVETALLQAARAAGLPERESLRTIESGLKNGAATPRQRPAPAPRSNRSPVKDDAPSEDLTAELDKRIEAARAMEEGAARDQAIEDLFPLLAGLGDLAQARYKRAITRAFAEIGARDFERLLKTAHQEEQRATHNGERYAIAGGCHCEIKSDGRGGAYTEPLCNFTAEILSDVAKDDGTGNPRRAFTVCGRLADGGALPVGAVDAAKFSTLAWVQDLWGVRAVIRAGRETKDRLREAIQLASADAQSSYIYTHTGWREIDGARVYLTNAGALGGNGAVVELERDLAHYRLPTAPKDPAEAMRASLRFLKIAPLEITAPLWAAAFLAPLAEVAYPDFVLWLYGKTGTLKSTLAALALSHYGNFDDKAMFSWGDTANRLEMACFLAKDALVVIDDFCPQSDPFKAREMERNAAQIVRNVGNQSGRGRLRRDLTMAQTYQPRGLVISTGEQCPDGQSIAARVYTLELRPDDVNLERLTAAQAEVGRYPHALAAYLLWLSPQWEEIAARLPAQVHSLRDQARLCLTGLHLRLPAALALLYTGFDLGVSFAVEVGALVEAEAEDLRARAWEALKAGSEAQARRVEQERPTVRFIEVLAALLAQGKIYLDHKDVTGRIGGGVAGEELIGWYDDQSLYLLGKVAYNRAARFLRDQGEAFPIKESTLRKYLIEEGILRPAQDKTSDVIRVGNGTRRVLCIDRQRVEEIAGELPPARYLGG